MRTDEGALQGMEQGRPWRLDATQTQLQRFEFCSNKVSARAVSGEEPLTVYQPENIVDQ